MAFSSWNRLLHEQLQQRAKTVRHYCQRPDSSRVQTREPKPPTQRRRDFHALHQYHPSAGVLPRKTR